MIIFHKNVYGKDMFTFHLKRPRDKKGRNPVVVVVVVVVVVLPFSFSDCFN